MADFGIFSEITFVDGTSPPINADSLNDIEKVVAMTDSELARSANLKFREIINYCFYRNQKTWLDFDDYTDWTNAYPSNGDLSDETSNNIIGFECLKVECIDAAASWLSFYQTLGSPVDLSTFEDGSASSTDDCIMLCFYVSSNSAFSIIQFRFGDDYSNCYYYATSALDNGWNVLYPQKSAFTTMGTPTGWNSISYIRMAPYVEAGNVGEYMYFQKYQLYRQDSVYSGYSNVFQKYQGSVTGYENIFTIFNDVSSLYFDSFGDIRKIGYMHLNSNNDPIQMRIYNNIICFRARFEFYCKKTHYSTAVTWYVNSSNYIYMYIYSSTLYLEGQESGTPFSQNVSLDNNLIKNERIYYYLEKEFQTIRAIVLKDGEQPKVLERETSIPADSVGDVYLGQEDSNCFSLLTDFEIGNKAIENLSNEYLGRCVKLYEEQSFVNNTIGNVAGMKLYLAPNTVYKIDVYLSAQNAGTTGDIKIAWTLSGCSSPTLRMSFGPSLTTTDVNDSLYKSSNFVMTTQIGYGCDGSSNESIIHESFILVVTENGGSLQLMAAQYTTDAGNPTTLETTSFIAATPITMKNSD